MQLTHSMEGSKPAAGDLTSSSTIVPIQGLPLNIVASSGSCETTVHVDLVVSTAAADQPDVRVTLPITTPPYLLGATQPPPNASVHQTWPAHPPGARGGGSSLGALKHESTLRGWRYHPMKSRCHHGSRVPPCASCRRAGMGPGNRNHSTGSAHASAGPEEDDSKYEGDEDVDDGLLFYFSGREMPNARPSRAAAVTATPASNVGDVLLPTTEKKDA